MLAFTALAMLALSTALLVGVVQLYGEGSDLMTDPWMDSAKRYLKAMLLGAFLSFLFHRRAVQKKVVLLLYGMVVMVLTSDMRWSKKANPDPSKLEPSGKKKRIIFVRHGESKWNEAFNKSKMPHKFFMSTMKAFIGETMKLLEFDSVLFDSPLNQEGFAQAKLLARALETYHVWAAKTNPNPVLDRDVAAMRGESDAPSTVVVASNLRRAIQTAVVGMKERLAQGQLEGDEGAKVVVVSHLQEVSRNVDTLSLAPKGEIPILPEIEENLPQDGSLSLNLDTLIDTENNGGNKPIFGTGLQRLQAFSKWAMDRPEEVIIVAGHSLWFRHFFRTYLAGAELSELAQEAKDLKMCNGGAVAFTLEAGSVGGADAFRISQESLTVVHEGFDNKKKKKELAKKKAKEAAAKAKKEQ